MRFRNSPFPLQSSVRVFNSITADQKSERIICFSSGEEKDMRVPETSPFTLETAPDIGDVFQKSFLIDIAMPSFSKSRFNTNIFSFFVFRQQVMAKRQIKKYSSLLSINTLRICFFVFSLYVYDLHNLLANIARISCKYKKIKTRGGYIISTATVYLKEILFLDITFFVLLFL